MPKALGKTKQRRRPPEEFVNYIVEIDGWEWGYSFFDQRGAAADRSLPRIPSPRGPGQAAAAGRVEDRQDRDIAVAVPRARRGPAQGPRAGRARDTRCARGHDLRQHRPAGGPSIRAARSRRAPRRAARGRRLPKTPPPGRRSRPPSRFSGNSSSLSGPATFSGGARRSQRNATARSPSAAAGLRGIQPHREE